MIWTLIDENGIESTDTQTVTVSLQVDVADVCYVSSDQLRLLIIVYLLPMTLLITVLMLSIMKC